MTIDALNNQVGGEHYKKHGAMQPWEILKHYLTPEEFRGFMKASAIVYLLREGEKGGDQDIFKAGHFLQAFEQYKKMDENQPEFDLRPPSSDDWYHFLEGQALPCPDTRVEVDYLKSDGSVHRSRTTVDLVDWDSVWRYRILP
jgi:hypothetical protein